MAVSWDPGVFTGPHTRCLCRNRGHTPVRQQPGALQLRLRELYLRVCGSAGSPQHRHLLLAELVLTGSHVHRCHSGCLRETEQERARVGKRRPWKTIKKAALLCWQISLGSSLRRDPAGPGGRQHLCVLKQRHSQHLTSKYLIINWANLYHTKDICSSKIWL